MPILYLSRYIIENKIAYYDLLIRVTTEGAWERWLLFILEGLRVTAEATVQKIDAIYELQRNTQTAIRSVTKSNNADLLAVLFEQPYCRISNVIERCRVSRPTATTWLNGLVEARVLTDIRVGRERLFINTAFFELLTRAENVSG